MNHPVIGSADVLRLRSQIILQEGSIARKLVLLTEDKVTLYERSDLCTSVHRH